MSRIHWIHLSDLHQNKRGEQTANLRNELPSYIKALGERDKINYLFFTGDFRYGAGDSFPDDTTKFFDEIRSAAGIEKDNQFVVIGNHDVYRNNRSRLKAIKDLEACYFSKDSLIEQKEIKKLKCGRNKLYKLLKDIVTEEQLESHMNSSLLHFCMSTDDINILHVDSTITCREGKKNDLLIGSCAFRDALERCDGTKPTIVLSHYPPSSFEPNERNAILRSLKKHNVQLWLSGHEHTKIIHKDYDNVYVVQSGNLTFENDTSPCIVEGFLDTDNGNGYFVVHRWIKDEGWGVFLTIDKLDAKSGPEKYYFDLGSRKSDAGATAACSLSLRARLCEYLNSYNGHTILVQNVAREIGSSEDSIIEILEDLQADGKMRMMDAIKAQWEILKSPI